MTDSAQAFSSWLRAARTTAGVTQKQVSEEMRQRGFSFMQTTIAKIEYGERPVRIEEAAALVELFGTTLDTALGLNPDHAAASLIDLANRRTAVLVRLRDEIEAELSAAYTGEAS